MLLIFAVIIYIVHDILCFYNRSNVSKVARGLSDVVDKQLDFHSEGFGLIIYLFKGRIFSPTNYSLVIDRGVPGRMDMSLCLRRDMAANLSCYSWDCFFY
jgi:hypothetical protein